MSFSDLPARRFHTHRAALGSPRSQRTGNPLAGESNAGHLSAYRTGISEDLHTAELWSDGNGSEKDASRLEARPEAEFVPCDLDSLDSDEPSTGTRTTDFYLASLAAKHGMRLATLDESIGHKAAFVIPV